MNDLAELGAAWSQRRHDAEMDLLSAICSHPADGLLMAEAAGACVALFDDPRHAWAYGALLALRDAHRLWTFDRDGSRLNVVRLLDVTRAAGLIRFDDRWLGQLLDGYPGPVLVGMLTRRLIDIVARERLARDKLRQATDLLSERT